MSAAYAANFLMLARALIVWGDPLTENTVFCHAAYAAIGDPLPEVGFGEPIRVRTRAFQPPVGRVP